MIGIIITGHGNFATGMEANAKLLADIRNYLNSRGNVTLFT